MDIQDLRLVVDAALFVLIWLVQMIIYPSFLYMSQAELDTWHPIYTRRISYFVIPLMFSQVGLTFYLWTQMSLISQIVQLILLAGVWLSTFLLSVPCHNQISRGEVNEACLRRLVITNWPRTVMWTVMLAVSLLLK